MDFTGLGDTSTGALGQERSGGQPRIELRQCVRFKMLLECVSRHHEQPGKPGFDSHGLVRHKNLLQRTREIALRCGPIGQRNACVRQPLEKTDGDGVRLFLTELIDRLALVPVRKGLERRQATPTPPR